MTAPFLQVHQAGPGVTVQDLGRPGFLGQGMSQGGVADWRALAEGAGLLGHSVDCAAIEMAGFGGQFSVTVPTRIALTGGVMTATLDGAPVSWNASHSIAPGQVLSIGGARRGVYGYLHVAGGIDLPPFLGSRATHLTGGIGSALTAGDTVAIQADAGGHVVLALPPPNRFTGGVVRILPTAQTYLFAPADIARFEATPFMRDTRGNRQGVRMVSEGAGFAADGQLSIVSEMIMPGDIQMTGEGTPFVLMPECQTTGGYPRIGTVIPADLPIVAQAAPGTGITFQFVSFDTALAAHETPDQVRANAARTATPMLRDPHEISDLLSYQLISGMIAGTEWDEEDKP
jgi:biotin-dependent carboxylase-like uncharacterized protein